MRDWKTFTICPACGQRLTLVDGIKAPTPFFIRCSGCRANLRVRMPGIIPALIGFVLLCLPSVVLAPLIASRLGLLWALLYGFWLLVGYLLMEVGAGILLFTFGRFTVKGKAASPATRTVSETPTVAEKAEGHAGRWWTRYEESPQDQSAVNVRAKQE